MRTNLMCPATEEPCEEGVCTKDVRTKDVLCIIEKREEIRRREADARANAARLLAAREAEAQVESMILAIAKERVLDAYQAKYGRRFAYSEEELTRLARLFLTHPDYANEARERAVQVVKSIKEGVRRAFVADPINPPTAEALVDHVLRDNPNPSLAREEVSEIATAFGWGS